MICIHITTGDIGDQFLVRYFSLSMADGVDDVMHDAEGQEDGNPAVGDGNPNGNPEANPNPVPVNPDPAQVLPEGVGLGLATQNNLITALLAQSIHTHVALVTFITRPQGGGGRGPCVGKNKALRDLRVIFPLASGLHTPEQIPVPH